ncbi:hypothetical protein OG204_08095 [Streptomyces sp. NBC_01387]|uniref:hypothetical protein n=1 Tax=unclassified Streptomyces TaxID=2593676 RepID=UPI0020243571|nr:MULTISPECIES: hypothetical protein [unclassified Streptomyces]MCX4551754.1 hypothetical protein [Streptomyces sp. NBC_01500]WSC23123.1 hypothetical protein OIE60_27525 [Streptomyces sp. NBC_01766]WSV57035.1 hypothetical protein OG282_26950 [Streptomyces sp. NBC_01014]
MDAELTALVTAGATALVQQMATDAWTRTRDRMAAFLARRGSAEPTAVAAELDAARAELTTAQQAGDTDTAADVQGEWRLRMRRALQADPEAAAELRTLLDEMAPPTSGTRVGVINNSMSGGTYQAPVIQAGIIGRQSMGGDRGRG